jgi:hypothetical protein
MPPALDRLLARLSALRLLRTILNAPESPVTCSTTQCRPSKIFRRQGSSGRPLKWKRWRDPAVSGSSRDHIRGLLEADDQFASHEAAPDKLKDASTQEEAGSAAAKWARTLARRERLQGQQGIYAVWCIRVKKGYPLPTKATPDAFYLWGTFIQHPQLVPPVIDHAAELLKHTGQTYPRFYEVVMSYWLPRNVSAALEYHHQMMLKMGLKKLPLRELVRAGQSSFTRATYEALIEMYRGSNERDLYNYIVPSLIQKGGFSMARRWHRLCTFRGDMPSDSVATDPVVQFFSAQSDAEGTSHQARREAGKYNQDLMRRLLGRDTAPVRFEDTFCAKMFATRSFPPESVIKGLAMVGVNEIGPQAVLAMATHTEPLEDLPARFEELRASGIALQGCVFSLALEKFALKRNWQLVRSLLDTDQHPDVFGDVEMQRRLLNHYLDQGDQMQVQRTLAILTLFHNDSSTDSWNLLLQTHIHRTGPQYVTEVLQDMRARGVEATRESVYAIKGLLRKRRPGHPPVDTRCTNFDDLRFVTRTFMTLLEFGTAPLAPGTWHEITLRFGMTGRLKELRRLLVWLLCWYAPRSRSQFQTLPSSPFLETATAKLRKHSDYVRFQHPIRQIFPPSLQQALIIWGFRAMLLPNAPLEQSLFGSPLVKKHYRIRLLKREQLHRKSWSIGLQTVVLLRDLGVSISRHAVIKALQMQFIVLFGRGRSRIVVNRIMEEVNTIPYAQYVREANEIWGSALLREPYLLGRDLVHRHMWHPRMRRRVDRPQSIRLDVVLGKGWQRKDGDGDEGSGKVVDVLDDPVVQDLKERFEMQAQAGMHKPDSNILGKN